MIDKKKIRNDILLIGSFLIVAIIALIFVFTTRKSEHLEAKVYVQNEIVLNIDLSNNEENEYRIQGLKGEVVIATKDAGIAIISSNCPHQDCVKMGYVKETNKPIICTYNAVYIIIEGKANYDVEV